MNDTSRNLLLLVVAGTIGYFLWKDYRQTTTAAAANSTAESASSSNLSTPINGLVNSSSGYLNQPVLPSTLPTSLDGLYNTLTGDGPGSGGSFDSSGGNADDTD